LYDRADRYAIPDNHHCIRYKIRTARAIKSDTTQRSPAMICAIAIVATLNTILAQMTMAARMIYGLAREWDLPGTLHG
jgi:hypothetical protein